MNIANIFGLHLGVMTKWHGKDLHKLTPYSLERIVDNDWFKDCKLLLTPLSKITEEHKMEFFSILNLQSLGKRFLRFDSDNGDVIVVIKIDSIIRELKLTAKATVWFCSKGYDVGIVEDEYKEVV